MRSLILLTYGVMSYSQPCEANSAVQITSERKTSHSGSRASWRWTNCWRCSSAEAGNSRIFTDSPCALYFALKRLDHSLVSPVVSLPVQYVTRPLAFCIAPTSIALAFLTTWAPLPVDEPPEPPCPPTSRPPAAASRAVAAAATGGQVNASHHVVLSRSVVSPI